MRTSVRVGSFIMLVGLVGLVSVRAQSISAPGWAQDQLAAWYEAFNAGEAKAVAALYAMDATIVPPDTAPIRGRAAIEAYHTKIHRETKFACSGSFDAFKVAANTAVAWGHDDCTETPRAGGAAKKTKSLWISVYEKQADGKWIIIRDVAESVK